MRFPFIEKYLIKADVAPTGNEYLLMRDILVGSLEYFSSLSNEGLERCERSFRESRFYGSTVSLLLGKRDLDYERKLVDAIVSEEMKNYFRYTTCNYNNSNLVSDNKGII